MKSDVNKSGVARPMFLATSRKKIKGDGVERSFERVSIIFG